MMVTKWFSRQQPVTHPSTNPVQVKLATCLALTTTLPSPSHLYSLKLHWHLISKRHQQTLEDQLSPPAASATNDYNTPRRSCCAAW